MKRTVKSASDLKRLALATGASVEHSGAKFNTTMERAQVTRPAPPPPAPIEVKPVAEPAPAKTPTVSTQDTFNINLDMEPVASAIDSGNEKVCKAIAAAVKEIHVPVQQSTPCSWTFKVKRDTRGFIESVEASPKP